MAAKNTPATTQVTMRWLTGRGPYALGLSTPMSMITKRKRVMTAPA